MNKKSSEQMMSAVFGLIITIVIVFFIYGAMTYFFESGRDTQAITAFQQFLNPIKNVCGGNNTESFSSNVNLRVAGKTYAVAQVYVPKGEGEFFVNSNGYIGFNQAPLMKCEGSSCLCLVKMEETEESLKGKCLQGTGGFLAGISMFLGTGISNAAGISQQKQLELAVNNAVGCPFWYYEGIDAMQMLITQLSVGQRFTYPFPEFWGGCSASQGTEDIRWGLVNYENSTNSKLCGMYMQPHCECWSETGDCSTPDKYKDIHCTKTTGAMLSSKTVRGMVDVPLAILMPIFMKVAKGVIKYMAKGVTKLVKGIWNKIKEFNSKQIKVGYRDLLINSEEGRAKFSQYLDEAKEWGITNPEGWAATQVSKWADEGMAYQRTMNTAIASFLKEVDKSKSKSLASVKLLSGGEKTIEEITDEVSDSLSEDVDDVALVKSIGDKAYTETYDSLITDASKTIFEVEAFAGQAKFEAMNTAIGNILIREFSGRIRELGNKLHISMLENAIKQVPKIKVPILTQMKNAITSKFSNANFAWLGKSFEKALKSAGISITQKSGYMLLSEMMTLYDSESITDEINDYARGLNIDKETPSFVGLYTGPIGILQSKAPLWELKFQGVFMLGFLEQMFQGIIDTVVVYVGEIIPNCLAPLLVANTYPITCSNLDDPNCYPCYSARIKGMLAKDIDWGQYYFPVIDTAELWQRREKLQFMQCVRLDELGCNNCDEYANENCAIKTNEKMSCGIEVDMLSAWDFFSWIRYGDCISDPSGDKDITLCYKMNCETYGCADCPAGETYPCDKGGYCTNAMDDNGNKDVDEIASWNSGKWVYDTAMSLQAKEKLKTKQIRNFQYWIGARDTWGHTGATSDISYLRVEKVCADCDYPPCEEDLCSGKLNHIVDLDPWDENPEEGIGDNKYYIGGIPYDILTCLDCRACADCTTRETAVLACEGSTVPPVSSCNPAYCMDGEDGDDDGIIDEYDNNQCEMLCCEDELDNNGNGKTNEVEDNSKELCGINLVSDDTDGDDIVDFCDGDNDEDGIPDEQDFMIVLTAHGILD